VGGGGGRVGRGGSLRSGGGVGRGRTQDSGLRTQDSGLRTQTSVRHTVWWAGRSSHLLSHDEERTGETLPSRSGRRHGTDGPARSNLSPPNALTPNPLSPGPFEFCPAFTDCRRAATEETRPQPVAPRQNRPVGRGWWAVNGLPKPPATAQDETVREGAPNPPSPGQFEFSLLVADCRQGAGAATWVTGRSHRLPRPQRNRSGRASPAPEGLRGVSPGINPRACDRRDHVPTATVHNCPCGVDDDGYGRRGGHGPDPASGGLCPPAPSSGQPDRACSVSARGEESGTLAPDAAAARLVSELLEREAVRWDDGGVDSVRERHSRVDGGR
jgi:hypothetical protein